MNARSDKDSREAFEKAGYWPNDVMWKAWQQAWTASRVALSAEVASVAVAIASIEKLKGDGMKSDFFKGVNDGLDRALDVLRALDSVAPSSVEPRWCLEGRPDTNVIGSQGAKPGHAGDGGAAPRRAVIFDLSLQADSRDAAINALANIERRIAMGEMTRGCSGGYDSGYTYHYEENAGPTHDEYGQQLKDWLAKRSVGPSTTERTGG